MDLATASTAVAASPASGARPPASTHASPRDASSRPAPAALIADAEQWLQFVRQCDLKGAARQLAEHAAFVGHADGVLQLALDAGFDYLRSERSLAELAQAMTAILGAAPSIRFVTAGEAAASSETLKQRTHRERGERQSAAEDAFLNDPDVQRLIQQHGARLVPDSIRPHDE